MKKLMNFFKTLPYTTKIIICLVIGVIAILIGGGIYFRTKSVNNNSLETFLVQFDTRGGAVINSQDVLYGGKVIEPEEPTKTGYTFIEWQYSNEKFDFNSFKVYKDMILMANWRVNDDTIIVVVHFDTDGGNQISDIELAKGTQLVPPLNPTKEGYEFKGWYLGEQRYDFLNPINEEITLKAHWEKILQNNNTISENTTNIQENTNNVANIDNSECKYTKKTDEVLSWEFGLGEETQLAPYWGFWDYSIETCKITYRTDDPSILSVSSSGVAIGNKLGTTNLYICVVNKATNEELDAYKLIANVRYEVGSQRAKTDGNNLLNAINGYYWYLDGYTYAYIHPTVVDWFDHKALEWESQYIDLQDNKFVVDEETVDMYYRSSNIHSEFLVNPTEFAYDLISDYNMHVSGNKLYITIGGKTYSFTKYTSKKTIKPTIIIDNKNITVDKHDSFEVTLSIKPCIADYTITTSSSNSSVAYCSLVTQSNYISTLHCFSGEPGNATITVTESKTGSSTTFNVSVNNNIISVNSISLNKTSLNLEKGNSETLIATINPSNADNKNITWTSSDTNIVTVNNSGKVKAVGKGNATITATTSDGGYSATCLVTVNNTKLTVSSSVGYSTIVSNSSVMSGISVKLTANGGSGTYTYYHIKLYNDEGLIGQTTDTSSNTLFVSGYKNGSYYIEYTVKDSEGNEVSGTSGKTTISM